MSAPGNKSFFENDNIQLLAARWLRQDIDIKNRRSAFQESQVVAELAIELARLRDKDEPEPFLGEGARLLVKAERTLADERQRPQRERREYGERRLVELSEPKRVPFNKLCRPGKREGGETAQDEFEIMHITLDDGREVEFRWKVFTTEKGFRQLIEKHIAETHELPAGRLQKYLGREKPRLSLAIKFIEKRGLYLDKSLNDQLNLVGNLSGGQAFVRDWKRIATAARSEGVFKQAKADELGLATVYGLWRTRAENAKLRAKKGALAKASF